MLNTKNFKLEAQYDIFVKPVLFPILSDFCMKLTSIRQSDVDGGGFLSSVLQDYSKCSKHILHLFLGELNRARGPDTCEIDGLDVLVGAPPFALSEASLNFIQTLGYFVRELEQGCHNINVSHMRDLLIRLPDFLSDIRVRVAVYLAKSPK